MLRPIFAIMVGFVLTITAFAAQAVEVKRVISAKGIEAWLVENHNNPILSMSVSFEGGYPAVKPGVAVMATSLLDEGAGPYDSQGFHTKLEDLTISLGFSASRDHLRASLSTLTKNQDEAFELMRLALFEPRFAKDDMERVRAQLQTALIRETQDPNSIAGRRWAELVFGDHPYSVNPKGTAQDLAAITRQDLVEFTKTRFGREGLAIGVVGAITPEQLAPLLDKTFGDLPQAAPKVDIAPVNVLGKGKIVVVERDFPQSTAIFSLPGLMRDDPDFYVATVVNYILGGGGFSSWLTEEVREKKGLAYSVGSGLSSFDHAAFWSGSVGTQNARMKESLDIIKGQLKRMRDNGPTAEDLQNAKTYLTGSFPLQQDSNGSIAGILVAMQTDNLGIDYLEKRNSFIEAVTMEDVHRVAKRLFTPDDLTVVVVGKPVGLKSSQ